MTAAWADLDPDLEDLAHALQDVEKQGLTHATVRYLTRVLDRLPIKDLAGRLPTAEPGPWRTPGREDVQQSCQDAADWLRDARTDEGTHLAQMIDHACQKLLAFDHALSRPGDNAVKDDDADDEDGDTDDEPQGGEDCHHCWVCGRTLTDPRSIERSLGPRCLIAVRYWDGIWAEIQVIAPDLASRVKAGEMTRWDAVDDYEAHDAAALDEIGERVWRELRRRAGH